MSLLAWWHAAASVSMPEELPTHTFSIQVARGLSGSSRGYSRGRFGIIRSLSDVGTGTISSSTFEVNGKTIRVVAIVYFSARTPLQVQLSGSNLTLEDFPARIVLTRRGAARIGMRSDSILSSNRMNYQAESNVGNVLVIGQIVRVDFYY